MAVITSGNHSYVLNEATTAIAINSFMQLPSMMPLFYLAQPSMGPQEQHASISGLGKMQVKQPTGTAARDNSVQQFERTWTHAEYALVVEVERKYIDDENFGHFARLGQQLGDSAMRTVEFYAAKTFNDAFAGAEVVCEDGGALCQSAHTNVDGGNSQDNSGTSALTYANYKTTRTAHRKFTDYKGENILINPDGILAPVDLEEDAVQIQQSVQQPGSANNDVNAFRGVEIFTWNFLTDTNNWFSIDQQLMKQNLPWFWRIPLEFFGNRDFDTQIASQGAYARWSFGPQDWRWVYGQNVT